LIVVGSNSFDMSVLYHERRITASLARGLSGRNSIYKTLRHLPSHNREL
jgi:hypothetical protein